MEPTFCKVQLPSGHFHPGVDEYRKKKKKENEKNVVLSWKEGVHFLASGQNRDERAGVRSLLTCELVLPYLGKESLLGIHYQ